MNKFLEDIVKEFGSNYELVRNEESGNFIVRTLHDPSVGIYGQEIFEITKDDVKQGTQYKNWLQDVYDNYELPDQVVEELEEAANKILAYIMNDAALTREKWNKFTHAEKADAVISLTLTWVDKIPGGKADGKAMTFDIDDIIEGIEVEFEHTDSVKIAMEITLDHLIEDKHYYKKLKKCNL